ncbi:MAG: hypothetical protein JNL85_04345 [Rubrivivax sp.]|nr:hypothetical protein [Rubrivivax sp.]
MAAAQPNKRRERPFIAASARRARPDHVGMDTEVAASVSDITSMPTLTLAPRRGNAPQRGRDSRALETAPPSLRHAPDSAWQRLMFWLLAPAPQEAAPPRNRLPAVREDFLLAVADVPGAAAHALRHRIVHAHSLRDLWHLRAEVFNVVGIEHAQGEAQQRLLRLNRHFPVRSARRSQFGSLGGL